MLGLWAACCPCSSAFEFALIDPGEDDSLFASEPESSAEPLTRVECLLALFVEGESFAAVVAAVFVISVGSVALTVGVVSMASGESETWFWVDESGISLFRLAVLLELGTGDNEGDDIFRQKLSRSYVLGWLALRG